MTCGTSPTPGAASAAGRSQDRDKGVQRRRAASHAPALEAGNTTARWFSPAPDRLKDPRSAHALTPWPWAAPRRAGGHPDLALPPSLADLAQPQMTLGRPFLPARGSVPLREVTSGKRRWRAIVMFSAGRGRPQNAMEMAGIDADGFPKDGHRRLSRPALVGALPGIGEGP